MGYFGSKKIFNAHVTRDGMSAYELAVKNGFEGTEEEWLVLHEGVKYILDNPSKENTADQLIAFVPYEDTFSIKVKVGDAEEMSVYFGNAVDGIDSNGALDIDLTKNYAVFQIAEGEVLYSFEAANGLLYLTEVGTIGKSQSEVYNTYDTSAGIVRFYREPQKAFIGSNAYKTVYDAAKVAKAVEDANAAAKSANEIASSIENAVKPETVAVTGRYAVYTHNDKRDCGNGWTVYFKKLSSNRACLGVSHPILRANQGERNLQIWIETGYCLQTSNSSEKASMFYSQEGVGTLDYGVTNWHWPSTGGGGTLDFEIMLDADAVANITQAGYFTIGFFRVMDADYIDLDGVRNLYFDMSE